MIVGVLSVHMIAGTFMSGSRYFGLAAEGLLDVVDVTLSIVATAV